MHRHKCTKCGKKRLECFLKPVRASDKPGSNVWICRNFCGDGRINKIAQSALLYRQSHGSMVLSNGYPAKSFLQVAKSNGTCTLSDVPGDKFILDVCCGHKMFWFSKNHPNVIYLDIKYNAGACVIMDFRKLGFRDCSFNLVVWDPPHLFGKKGNYDWLNEMYGSLDKGQWPNDLTKGFSECMRVLKDRGILIFKWSEGSVSVSTVLSLFSELPLFGHTSDKKGNTHWLCFMKIKRGFIDEV